MKSVSVVAQAVPGGWNWLERTAWDKEAQGQSLDVAREKNPHLIYDKAALNDSSAPKSKQKALVHLLSFWVVLTFHY